MSGGKDDVWWLSQLLSRKDMTVLYNMFPDIPKNNPELPVDLWSYVLSFVDRRDVFSVIQVCKVWKKASKSKTFWYKMGIQKLKELNALPFDMKHYDPFFRISAKGRVKKWIIAKVISVLSHSLAVCGNDRTGYFFFYVWNEEYATYYMNRRRIGFYYCFYMSYPSPLYYTFKFNETLTLHELINSLKNDEHHPHCLWQCIKYMSDIVWYDKATSTYIKQENGTDLTLVPDGNVLTWTADDPKEKKRKVMTSYRFELTDK